VIFTKGYFTGQSASEQKRGRKNADSLLENIFVQSRGKFYSRPELILSQKTFSI